MDENYTKDILETQKEEQRFYETLDYRIKSLNKKMKDFIKSEIFTDSKKKLYEKYKLDELEIINLDNLIFFTLVSFLRTEDFSSYLEDELDSKSTIIQKAIKDEIFNDIIPSGIQALVQENWDWEDEKQEIISDSVNFFEIPLPPGFRNHTELLYSYLDPKNVEEKYLDKENLTINDYLPGATDTNIRPMEVKNQEIISRMERKPSENTVTWEDRIALSNEANPNIVKRSNTDQTLPRIGKHGGDSYRENTEE